MLTSTSLKLRPMADAKGKNGQAILILAESGLWSIVRVDMSWWRVLGGAPRLVGEVEGHDAFVGSYEYADMLEVDVANCVGWIDLDDLPRVVTATPG